MGSSLVIGTTNWVLVGKAEISGTGTSLTVSGIPAGYSMLFVLTNILMETLEGNESPLLNFNDDGGNNYAYLQTDISPAAGGTFAATQVAATAVTLPESGEGGDAAITSTWINQKANVRTINMQGGNRNKTRISTGYWNSANEVNKIVLATTKLMDEGSFLAVYGVI